VIKLRYFRRPHISGETMVKPHGLDHAMSLSH